MAIVSTLVLVALAGCVYGWLAGLAQVVAPGRVVQYTAGASTNNVTLLGAIALLGAVLYCAWTTIACVLNVWTCVSSAQDGDVSITSSSNTTGAMVTLALLALAFCGLLAWSRMNEFPPRASWARVVFAGVFVWAVVGVLVKEARRGVKERAIGVQWVGGVGALVVGLVGVATGVW